MPPRDIDYAALAVENAIRERFGRQNDLADLKVTAGETTLSVTDGGQSIDGSRDQLLARLRRSDTYADFWQ